MLKEKADKKANPGKKKYNFARKKKRGPKPRPKYYFLSKHPQSQTHWQVVRKDEQKLVPALSKLPPDKNTNPLTYQKCILLLFKPFNSYADLFNGISWNESYQTTNFASPYTEYIDNIQEMHKGLGERENQENDDNNELNEDTVNELDEEEPDQPIEMVEKELHISTTTALETIKIKTSWLNESVTNHRTINNSLPEYGRPLQTNRNWKLEIKRQNEAKLNNEEENEIETVQLPIPSESVPAENDNNVGFLVETCDDKNLDDIAEDIAEKFSLNKKQKVAFKLSIENVIKRERNEPTEQLLAYVVGCGGTGKSQIIKAIVAFHDKIKARHKIKLTAYTGTAAKHIGGSTTSALFSTSSKSKKES